MQMSSLYHKARSRTRPFSRKLKKLPPAAIKKCKPETWALVGIGIHVLSPPVRKSIKVMGAVRIGARPQWHSHFVKVFNAETFIEFLGQLVRYYRGTQGPLHH